MVSRLDFSGGSKPVPEGVAGSQFRKQGEVAVPGQQHLDPVRDAECGDAGIVDNAACNVRAAHEAAQKVHEVAGLADHSVRWRRRPRPELIPGMRRRGRFVLPDAAVGHHAQELVAARPGNRPWATAFRESDHECMRLVAGSGFAAVRVDEQVGTYGD